MDPDDRNAALGIDGGGTRCRTVLRWGGRVVTVETGPANVSSDFDGAIASVRDGLAQVADAAGLDVSVLASVPAWCGLAGVISTELSDRVAASLPLANATVADDRPAAVRGALGPADGFVVHCGTGSFLARQEGGTIRLAGGWGAVLGDEGSAAWLGREALRGVLDCVDGLRPASALADGLSDRHGGPAGIVRFAASATGADFAALAPLVTGAAEAQDALAVSVMRRAGADLARRLKALGWRPGASLCLTGGVGPRHAPWLTQAMRDAVRAPRGTPLDGALALASDRTARAADPA